MEDKIHEGLFSFLTPFTTAYVINLHVASVLWYDIAIHGGSDD